MIYLELEVTIITCPNMFYEGCYENDEVCFLMWIWNLGNNHYYWLHGSINLKLTNSKVKYLAWNFH